MKKLITILMAMCLVLQMFCIVPVFAEDSGMCGDDAYWQLSNGVLTISGTGRMCDYTYYGEQPPWLYLASSVQKIVIEEGITSIGQCAFSSDEYSGEECVFSALTEVEIANTVTEIRRNAFAECIALETITIPASVTEIEDSVFVNCYALYGFNVDENSKSYKSVGGVLYTIDGTELKAYPIGSGRTEYNIEKGTKRVAGYAFSQAKKLEEITFNDELTHIDDEAFFSCENITKIDLPDGIKYLGGGAFQDCIKLESIRLPKTVEEVSAKAFDNTAFFNCLDNWDDGVLYLNTVLLSGDYFFYDPVTEDFVWNTKKGHVAVREGTTLIANEAFFLTDVDSVYLPETLLRIGFGAFCYLDDLESVVLPNSLIEIGDSAFTDCGSLKEVTIGPNIQRIGHGAFNNTAYVADDANYIDGILYYDNYLIDFHPTLKGTAVIREGTTLMAEGAFFNESGRTSENYGSSISSVVFPKSLTKISENAFMDCTNIETIEIPSHITEIGDYAFGYFFDYDFDADRVRYTKQYGYLIKCEAGSAAEEYAILNGIDYMYLPKKADSIEIEGYSHLVGYSYEDSFELNAKLYPEDASEKVSWYSDNESVAFVSNGLVTLHGAGTATITACTESGLTDTVTVTSLEKTYIMLDEQNEISFTYEGEKRKYYFSPYKTSDYSFNVNGDTEVIFNIYENGRMIDFFTDSFVYNFECGGGYEIVVECANNPSDFSFSVEEKEGGGNADIGTVYAVELMILKTPFKTAYYVGEELDLTGLQTAVKYSDGSLAAIDGGYEVSGFYPEQAGKQTITVTIEGVSNSFDITLYERPVSSEYGDVNGDGTVNVSDLAILKKQLARLISEETESSDINGDGSVNVSDLALLKKILAKLI